MISALAKAGGLWNSKTRVYIGHFQESTLYYSARPWVDFEILVKRNIRFRDFASIFNKSTQPAPFGIFFFLLLFEFSPFVSNAPRLGETFSQFRSQRFDSKNCPVSLHSSSLTWLRGYCLVHRNTFVSCFRVKAWNMPTLYLNLKKHNNLPNEFWRDPRHFSPEWAFWHLGELDLFASAQLVETHLIRTSFFLTF